MAEWHSQVLHLLYESFGWIAFLSWSVSFWPQVLLNYKRKSVVGLNFDFVVLNFTKHSSYLVFNAAMFFSPTVQAQYHRKYGPDELIPVAPSDVAFSVHAVALTAVTLVQLCIYQRGAQKVSFSARVITALAWTAAAVFLVWQGAAHHRWLEVVTFFNYIQLVMTSIKYIPQAWMNYRRKSTDGWSIENILLDFTGGALSLAMMILQSADQGSLQNLVGNVGKLGLSLEVMLFDAFFILQHYVLYTDRSSRTVESAAPKVVEKSEYRAVDVSEH
ncbi:cystinosin [Klebsormidium nitens]|uniref:Cystinosin homolog n=1 Tax=Klebsormidium nitens TaxID=105231 RepID=A0A1Y1IHW2_KLENI|nr:cystinosin [Klebsormidium nitens]|eukprot:GAQ87728.1 cystinosin [Klebsormidium nitens]